VLGEGDASALCAAVQTSTYDSQQAPDQLLDIQTLVDTFRNQTLDF
jgi:hypothetical protein